MTRGAHGRLAMLLHALAQAGEVAEHPLEVLRDAVPVAAQEGAHREVLIDRQVGENHPAFGHVAEAAGDDLVGGQGRDVLVEKCDAAGARAEEAGDGAHGGALASAVGAQYDPLFTGFQFP